MKASSIFTTPFSVTGLSVLFALGSMVPVLAQEGGNSSGGSFTPPGGSPPAAQLARADSAAPAATHSLLLDARRALANGNVDEAKSLVEMAKKGGPSSSWDTPEQVEAMIGRHNSLVALKGSGDADGYNQQAARFLLEQADALVTHGEMKQAASMLELVRSFKVQFGTTGLTPESVAARMSQASSQMSPAGNAAEQAVSLLSQAQLAFDRGELDKARTLITQIRSLNVPDSAFSNLQVVPWELQLRVDEAIARRQDTANTVQQADYYPELDQTRNMQVSGTQDDRLRANAGRGKAFYDSGISALSNNDVTGAMEYFRMAWQYRDQLDPQSRADLDQRLANMNMNMVAPASGQQEVREAIDGVEATDDQLKNDIAQDVLRQRAIAQRMKDARNPRGALAHMRITRDNIENTNLDAATKQQLLMVVEREIAELQQFVDTYVAVIETEENNAANLGAVEADRVSREDVERKVQALVDDFNKLLDEQRWAEAQVVAQQAWELDPDNEAVAVMMQKARFQGNFGIAEDIKQQKEDSYVQMWQEMDKNMAINTTPDRPIEFDKDRWEMVRNRPQVGGANRSPKENMIWSALKNQEISIQYNQTPLQEAISILAQRSGINIIFDTRALEVESVSIDTPITHNIINPISVESALNIVLGSTGLVFKVEDEVVKITNKAALQSDMREATFYVGDLVVPIPDFSGNPLNMQFITPQNPSQPFTNNEIWNGNGGLSIAPENSNQVPINMATQLAQAQNGFGNGTMMWNGVGPQIPTPTYSTWGAKEVSRGGITAADFDELIELIEETIDPDSWEANGGTGRMRAFPSTLSLIVTTTQENQDRIQDLLKRLRELNDVQIVVEVRFIRLRDDFFERIGMDFDFRFNDSTGLANQAQIPDNFNSIRNRQGNIVGRAPIDNAFVSTADLDIPLTNNSFGASRPQFGGFAADSALNFGFAILSDIEVFFLLEAAKGDTRSNVTQAPTVTMFNGQSASVFDGEQRPFVTSITPVVGDFAAAQQPVITILPEGTQLNVKAVVSGDRRFVKMTLVPFFSQITEVTEFRFEGERRVRRREGSDLEDILRALAGNNLPDDIDLGQNELDVIETGTTVQLPVFANTTVTTTVSVPDGGTVLLGGIKSMSEGRNERGVPFLSNIPYVNRIFTNIGIGRTTNSLMMMVTPRIIIQEEEEANQVNSNR